MPAHSIENLNIYFPEFDLNTDPQTMIDARSMQINLQIHRGLFRYLPNGIVEPDLADKWSYSADHRVLTITLKSNLFSDGSRIFARHVVNTFARLFLIDSSISSDLSLISGSKDLKVNGNISKFGVISKNDSTVEFYLDHPNALFIKQLAAVDCSILPIESLTMNKEAILSKSWRPNVGAGPYKIEKSTKNEIILEKWRDDIFQSQNSPKRISISLTNETKYQNLVSQIKTDSLDQAVLSESQISEMKSLNWKQFVTDLSKTYFLILNPARIDLGLRNMISNSLEPQEIKKNLTPGFSPAYGLIPPIMGGSIKNPNPKKIEENSNFAKMKSDKLEVLLPDVWENKESIKQILEEAFKKINLKVTFKTTSIQDWNRKKIKKDYDILVNARGLDYPDGIAILNYFRSGVEGNYYHIADKKIDKKLDDATQEFNQSKRFELYKEIQDMILLKSIIVPLFFGNQFSGLWSPRVKIVPPHPLGYHFLPFEMIELNKNE